MIDVTQILIQIDQGDPAASEQLLPLVYDELRKLAVAKLSGEKPGQTLQATALVHEAYLRLVNVPEPQRWNGRGHFFAAAAESMRRILVEQARRKQRLKHGGEYQRAAFEESRVVCKVPDEELLALDEALDRLEDTDPEKYQLIQLRYFVGLTNEQAADVMGISPTTAKRHWRFARSWLHREIHPDT